ncbi:DNA processing protein DprA, partial [Leptospira interrogans serovar Pomona]|nr:DNA processing protein DprA [Leptospira interrogans serovar Pomona]
MNPLILVDSYVSKFCSKNGIFKKLNSWANLNAYLERFLPSSVLRGALYASEKISNDLKKTGFSVLS